MRDGVALDEKASRAIYHKSNNIDSQHEIQLFKLAALWRMPGNDETRKSYLFVLH